MTSEGAPPRAGGWWRLVVIALVLVGGVVGANAVGFGTEAFRLTLREALVAWGPWAPLAFSVIKVGTILVAFPSAPVTFTGGVLFGPVWGTVINVVAATIGASLSFFMGRMLGRSAVETRLVGRLAELDARLSTNGFLVVLFLRLVPLFPFNAINYGAGLTRVSFRDYFWGTALGIIPGAAVYTYMGAAAAELSVVKVFIALSALGLLALLPKLPVVRALLAGRPDDAP